MRKFNCNNCIVLLRSPITNCMRWQENYAFQQYTLKDLVLVNNDKSETEVAQLCLTLRDPIDYSLPGSSVHGILQARILEWVTISFSYYVYLTWTADSLEKTLMLGKTEGKRIRRWQKLRWLDSMTDSIDTSLSKLWEIVGVRGAWCAAVQGSQRFRHNLATEQQ